jgi:hypothetical protein
MSRFRVGLPGRARGNAVQYFTYGPLEFNVSRALVLAADRRKYRPETCRPSPDWIGPGIAIDDEYVDRCPLNQPVVFATLVLPGHPRQLLIDGNHRVAQALRNQKLVKAVVLDLEDTLKVMAGPDYLIEEIRQAGLRLGLLKQASAGR